MKTLNNISGTLCLLAGILHLLTNNYYIFLGWVVACVVYSICFTYLNVYKEMYD